MESAEQMLLDASTETASIDVGQRASGGVYISRTDTRMQRVGARERSLPDHAACEPRGIRIRQSKQRAALSPFLRCATTAIRAGSSHRSYRGGAGCQGRVAAVRGTKTAAARYLLSMMNTGGGSLNYVPDSVRWDCAQKDDDALAPFSEAILWPTYLRRRGDGI